MKMLTQADMPYPTSRDINVAASRIGPLAAIKDMTQLAKAINEYQPDVLVLEEKYIDGMVQAYREQNKAKIISFGTQADNPKADITIDITKDIPKPNLDALGFKEDVEKTDISVFCDDEKVAFLATFLCSNYKVKAYGPIKLNSPRYLGNVSPVDKYEILNRSKVAITFNAVDAQDSILLGAYPLSYSREDLFTRSFNNLVTLTQCMDDVCHEDTFNGMKENIKNVKDVFKSDNTITSVIEIFKKLGFNEQVSELNAVLEEMLS